MHMNDASLARLFQLISPSLPIGGYSYSQGVEWAVEQGWISNEVEAQEWLNGLLHTNMLYVDLPVLLRMMRAWNSGDEQALARWNEYLLASRETAELRQEEVHRARAFTDVLINLEQSAASVRPLLLKTQHACFSFACVRWGIAPQQASYGLLWSWLENLTLAAVKIIPLGQAAGQRILFNLSQQFVQIIGQALQLEDDDLGASCMAQTIASCRHETQYSRLFRS